MNVMVTGATGFIGRHLVSALLARGHSVVALVRDGVGASAILPAQATLRVADLTDHDSLVGICHGVDLVFHLAGYAHAVDEDEERDTHQHFRTTVEGTRALLQEALDAGVRRLVYVSSVKAMGEGTDGCIDESYAAEPTTAYGQSRLAAERILLDAARSRGNFEAVVLRLPMVYGRENKGNLARMIDAIDRGRFPPLPPMRNHRSMIHVDDVVQALLLAADRSEAVNQVYLVTDGRSYATDEIYRQIRTALGSPPSSFHIPLWMLKLGARLGDLIGWLSGRSFFFNSIALQKLVGSAWYSPDKIVRDLGFRPERALPDALPEMVQEHRHL